MAVAHQQFRDMSVDEIKALFKDGPDCEKVLIDVKGLYPVEEVKKAGLCYWRL